ncbi:response regulator transcription factor [Paenibacillus sp. J5C_2022]|uniref:response regulator transcription factor n=1 Tax=Paenibacillus sp. J5C2022 TaxID=2977129 RepID=UPI0021D0299B|nr:response regulator transcription factor [Paenibacillus sp. J5C2022]MCU6712964.1 response regulator transcription factor [Paenibacillus sp. J5C2022]
MYKVFIADDEPFIIEGLHDAIDWTSLELAIVGSAENGQQALDALEKTHVDILITDISMPVMNGLELIRKARQIHPGLHVIILSGFNDFDYLKEGMRLGIENYLLKPINLHELKATLDGVIEKLDKRNRQAVSWQEEDISVLRDNIIYRWLNREIGSGELHERAEMLGIDLMQEYFLVVMLGMGQLSEDARRHLFRLLEQDTQHGIPFHDRDGNVGIVMALQREEDGGAVVSRLLDRLREAKPEEMIRVAIGEVASGEEQAAASYAQAKKAMEFVLIHPERELLQYSELAVDGTAGQGFALDWGEYARHLAAKEKEQLLGLIEEDFGRFSQEQGVTPGRLQSLALELMVQLKIELGSIKKTEVPELIRENTVERIMRADSLGGMIEVVREIAEEAVDSLVRDTKSPVIQQILDRIQDNCAEELSLKSLSAEYNIHPVYLGRLFHKETNETFSEYLNRYRIDRAKALLGETHLKVSEIAREVGYWEMGYFYKQFKKYVGVSPKDFKALL